MRDFDKNYLRDRDEDPDDEDEDEEVVFHPLFVVDTELIERVRTARIEDFDVGLILRMTTEITLQAEEIGRLQKLLTDYSDHARAAAAEIHRLDLERFRAKEAKDQALGELETYRAVEKSLHIERDRLLGQLSEARAAKPERKLRRLRDAYTDAHARITIREERAGPLMDAARALDDALGEK